MARKNYSDEFRRQAVELYESTPGATVKAIAEVTCSRVRLRGAFAAGDLSSSRGSSRPIARFGVVHNREIYTMGIRS